MVIQAGILRLIRFYELFWASRSRFLASASLSWAKGRIKEIQEGCLGEVIGYKRRKNISLTAIDHIDWLFRRHILHESPDAIAEMAGNHITTVESSIKEFRQLLDLQFKHTVHCLEHRQRPWPIHDH